MHVMDTECEKIGGGCLAAESAPELAKPSESPLLVGDAKTPQVVKNLDEEKNLVNGGSDHPCTTTTNAVVEEEEGIEEEASAATVEEMEVDGEKGTKEVVEEEEEEQDGEDEEIVEEAESGQLIATEDKEDIGEEIDEEINVNREVEEDEEEEVEMNLSKSVVLEESSANVDKTKDKSLPQVADVTVEERSVTLMESKEKVSNVKVNEIKIESKPASPATIVQSKETKEEVAVIPISESSEQRTSVGLSNKLSQRDGEKRKIVSDKEGEGEVSSGSESDTSRKKIKVEPDLETTSNEPPPPRADHPAQHLVDDDRERFIQEFISQCSQSVEEMDRAAERLHKEVETLAELARAKELEWNAILRVRKMREEMLERLLRKRRLATDEYLERTHLENSVHKNINKFQGNNQLMMVPIVSSSPGAVMSSRGPPPVRLPEYGKQQRPILPKPYGNLIDPNCTTREGRNGPIVDVKSIIADYSSGYRSRHPESVPRRGRRMRGGPIIEPPPNRMSVNPSLISMANMALGSGASIRTVSDSPYNLSQDHSRPSSTDPGRGGASDGGGSMGYKDVLVQFAKMTNQAGPGHAGKGPPNGVPPPPPPPYPEVTLHPVSRPGSSPPTPPSSSLLHGILTKSSGAMGSAAATSARPPANFSPTLARLLTAPDRPPHPVQPPPHFRPQHPPRVSIADILSSSKKSRNEITITPVSGNPSAKPKEDVVLLQDDDETEVSDRLVIDESADNEEIPQCQGCRQKPAQFVCAGCGNQWYCSRECQVTAWEEHSDVCSG
uniref:Putative inactive protein kinase n=1 Tax=Panstrongylus megistus TaxID=65343 RepID=A0A069DWA3_9HEMI